jgi:hypothetical protein
MFDLQNNSMRSVHNLGSWHANSAQIILTAQSILEILAVGVGSGMHIDEIPPERIPVFFSVINAPGLVAKRVS